MYDSSDDKHRTWSKYKSLGVALALSVLSCALVWLALQWGAGEIARSPGYPGPNDVQSDLFRFDSVYYLEIAKNGYSYNGDPASSPNIVFAPLFPMLVAAVSRLTSLDPVTAGFALNHLLLWGALALLFASLRAWIGAWPALFTLLAMSTSAGSYAFHAFYSESTMLFFLALCLFSIQRDHWLLLALSAACLGASRMAALPMLVVISLLQMSRAYRNKNSPRVMIRFVAYAALSWLGVAGYFAYIWYNYGEPFTLLNMIQSVSWGKFHQEIYWLELLSGGYLFKYWSQAFGLGAAMLTDIKTLNLVWTTLALVASVYWLWRRPRHILTFLFVPYFAFIYWSGAGSDYLISAHRFFLIMLPIFISFTDLHIAMARRSQVLAWGVSSLLLILNATYGAYHAASFNQGVWYYF